MAGKHVKVAPEMAERAAREVDWARLDAMTDEDMERAIAADPGAAPPMSDTGITAARALGPQGGGAFARAVRGAPPHPGRNAARLGAGAPRA